MESTEKQLSRCLRLLLEGKLSLDHIIEEYKAHEQAHIAEVIDFMEEASKNINRYSKGAKLDSASRKKIKRIVQKLEKDF